MNVFQTQQSYVTARDARSFSIFIEGRNSANVIAAESAKFGNKLGRDGMEITEVETRTWYCPERNQHEFAVVFRVKHKLSKTENNNAKL